MIRFIIYAILGYLIYRVVKNVFRSREGKSGRSGKHDAPVQGEELVEDPYCHTYIPVSNACTARVGGSTVYFCSKKCLEAYRLRQE